MADTELDWLPSLVAEVSAHLGEPTGSTPEGAERVSAGVRRWRWLWDLDDVHWLDVIEVEPEPGLTSGRFEVRAAGAANLGALWREPPTVDDVRRLFEVAGLLPTANAWTNPPEPGPEVTAVRDVDGDVWIRAESGCGWALKRTDEAYYDGTPWPEVMSYAPLTDATDTMRSPS